MAEKVWLPITLLRCYTQNIHQTKRFFSSNHVLKEMSCISAASNRSSPALLPLLCHKPCQSYRNPEENVWDLYQSPLLSSRNLLTFYVSDIEYLLFDIISYTAFQELFPIFCNQYDILGSGFSRLG